MLAKNAAMLLWIRQPVYLARHMLACFQSAPEAVVKQVLFADVTRMCTHVQNAIDIINDILSKVDDFAKEAPAPGAAAPAGESPPVQKGGKKKDKKAKKAASAAPVAAAENEKASDPFAMADLRAARVLEVEPVENSEKLWLCKVDCGDENPKQIVAGLQAYVPRDVMQGLDVVTICNLKPAKLAGQMSEAMILAASCMEGDTRIVKPLKPANGCSPGERVHVGEVGQPGGEPVKTLKSAVWKTVTEQLKTQGGVAVYAGKQLCTKAGICSVNGDIADGSSIS